MKTITVIGLDIAKSVFQVHGVDAEGKVAIRPIDLRRMAAAIARSHGGSGAIAGGDARSAVRCCSLFIWAQGKFCLKRRRLL